MAKGVSEEEVARENARTSEIRDKLFDVVDECSNDSKYEDRDITRALIEVAVATAVASFNSIDTANSYVHDMTDAVVFVLKGQKPS